MELICIDEAPCGGPPGGYTYQVYELLVSLVAHTAGSGALSVPFHLAIASGSRGLRCAEISAEEKAVAKWGHELSRMMQWLEQPSGGGTNAGVSALAKLPPDALPSLRKITFIASASSSSCDPLVLGPALEALAFVRPHCEVELLLLPDSNDARVATSESTLSNELILLQAEHNLSVTPIEDALAMMSWGEPDGSAACPRRTPQRIPSTVQLARI